MLVYVKNSWGYSDRQDRIFNEQQLSILYWVGYGTLSDGRNIA